MDDAYTFGGWLKQRRKRLHLTQRELAQEVGYAEVTVRKVEADELRPSAEMAQRLAAALQIPMADLAQFLRFARDEAGAAPTLDPNAALPPSPPLAPDYPAPFSLVTAAPIIDWGEAPDIGGFQGREQEVDRLRQWLAVDQCRTVAVLGMGGIGKTAVATYVAAGVQAQFTAVIWRSLRNAPPLAELLRQWLQVLSPPSLRELPQDVDTQLAMLLDYLRGQRCLLVLDNFETVLQAERPGRYLPGYEGYGQLLKQIGAGRHQSCLLLTSREKPPELIPLAGERAPVRTLAVTGLPLAAGRALMQDRNLRGSDEDWAALHARFSGNPLALQIVAETIGELFAGDIGRFLRQETFLFGDIVDLLEQQHARLSPLEQDIMFWLAVEREPVGPEELAADLAPPPTVTAVLAALHALRHRCLVEQTESGFTLQNVVLEFYTAVLVDQAGAEIIAGSPDLLRRYALLMASAKEYVRETQRSLILGPIAHRAVRQFGPAALGEQFDDMLAQLRTIPRRQGGYAGGNILNLMVQARIDLDGRDFSQLPLWQADLRRTVAHGVDLRQSDLSQSAFTDTFPGIFGLAFSPDGQRIAAATMGEEIRMWQAAGGKPLATWVAHSGWVRSICFSPDGKTLASAGGDQMVRLWNGEDGRLLATLSGHTSEIMAVCFSHDGSVVASCGSKAIRLWDTRTGACVRVLEGYTSFVNSICFSPAGGVLASGGYGDTVWMWDWRAGECLAVLHGHTSFINSTCFSPDGRVFASGGNDRTVRIWDTESRECLYVLRGHTDSVCSICFSPDGRMLASGSNDQTIRLWHSQTGECLSVLLGHTNFVSSVCFSPDGSKLASGSYDQTIRLWQWQTPKSLHLLQGHKNSLSSVAFHPDGSILATGGYDQAVRLWNRETGACLRTLQGHTAWIWPVCFSPDGRVLASGSDDETIRLWDSRTGTCLHVLRGHTQWTMSLNFSPDGSLLASAGYDEAVKLWDTHTGVCVRALDGHTSSLGSVCFNHDGSMLASGSYDQTVRIWDLVSGKCLRVLSGHMSYLTSVCFSPDGDLLASCSDDQTVRVWDSRSGECLYVLQGHTAQLWSVCFSPDGEMLASGSGDQTVRLWDRYTGRCLRVLKGHTDWVSSVCFSRDVQFLASASNDETIRLWDVKTGVCLKILRSDRPYERMNIAGARGLTPPQIAMLKGLGAVDDTDPQDDGYRLTARP